MDFEYGIIGGGPAGYTIAMQLAKNGHSVCLFEKNYLGGTCLNRGCIPTKSLLHSSELYKKCLELNIYGIKTDFSEFDFAKVAQKKDLTVEKIRKSLELAVKNSGVTVINAKANVIDKNTISADKEYKVQEIIIATGSKPKEIKGLEFDGKFILNSDDILKLDKLPKSILIVGSGAIGIEWARIFSNFGTEVNLVELEEHLIPQADIEVSKRIERIFKQNKIRFYLKDKIDFIKNKTVVLNSGVTIEPDFVLVAVGRTPNKIELINSTVIGDACGEIQLAHYAIMQAHKLVKNENSKLDKKFIPSIIYGQPEIAWIGIREQDCDDSYNKISFPITALGKSWCDDATEGFIKIITKDNLIVGAHIISKEDSAIINQILIAMQYNIKIEELKNVCFAHPTYSEGIFEAICRL